MFSASARWFGIVGMLMLTTGQTHAIPVPLANATATFSQAGFLVSAAIDGVSVVGAANGWAIDPNSANTPPQAMSETAVFETVTDLFTGGGTLTFVLDQVLGSQHTIGRFRLSATTSDRGTFADGLQSGGDVSAVWTILDPIAALSAAGATMTELGDKSILLSGVNPPTDIYTVTAFSALAGITGFRLETIEDVSLPDGSGPGRQPDNGNFVLSEFRVDAIPAAVPAPGSLALIGLGLAALGLTRRRKKA